MKHIYYKFGAWVSTLPLLLLPVVTYAQLSEAQSQLGEVGKKVGAGQEQNLPALIGKLINVFLSVLGIVFVVMVVYAGYLWMTDAGEGAKVKKAKGLLGTAIIGIIITIAAYAISNFVITQLVTAAKA